MCSDRLDTDFSDIDLSQLDTSDFDSVNCLSELQWCNDQPAGMSPASVRYSAADELFEVRFQLQLWGGRQDYFLRLSKPWWFTKPKTETEFWLRRCPPNGQQRQQSESGPPPIQTLLQLFQRDSKSPQIHRDVIPASASRHFLVWKLPDQMLQPSVGFAQRSSKRIHPGLIYESKSLLSEL